MRNIVGNRVRLARLQLEPKMTQSDLARELQLEDWDIGRTGVAKIELGLRQVTDKELAKLAKVLNVSLTWLFGEEA